MAMSKQDFSKRPLWQKGLVLAVIIVLIGVLWYFIVYSPTTQQIPALEGRIQKLKSDIKVQEKAKETKRDLQAQIREIQEELERLRAKLPEEKEIPALLSSVTEVGRMSGLDFVLFRQDKAVRKDYYSEIPIQITVEGGFHQVAQFLSEVGNMDRILQVSDLKMGKYKSLNGGGDLETSLQATTYKYESKPLPSGKATGRRK